MTTSLPRRQFGIVTGAAAVAAGSHAQAQESSMEGSAGLREYVLSVFDFERIVAPMTNVGNFQFKSLPDAPRGQWAAWNVPEACTRIEQGYLEPMGSEDGAGGIRLVKFHGVEQRVMRSSQRTWDTGGLFDVDVFTPDVDDVYRKLQTYGWTAFGEPVDYQEAHLIVRQVVAKGPDGLNVAIIQRYSPPAEDLVPGAAMSAIRIGVHMVKSYQESRRFLLDVLGWEARLEFTIEGQAEPGADVLGLPQPYADTAVRHIGMFSPKTVAAGGIELIENVNMYGKDFSEHCVAPNVGLLLQRFPVEDADAYAAEITSRGGTLYTEPMRYDIALLGAVNAFTVRTPDGGILEFYQQV